MREHLVQLDHMGDILGEIDPTVGPWDLSHPASQTDRHRFSDRNNAYGGCG